MSTAVNDMKSNDNIITDNKITLSYAIQAMYNLMNTMNTLILLEDCTEASFNMNSFENRRLDHFKEMEAIIQTIATSDDSKCMDRSAFEYMTYPAKTNTHGLIWYQMVIYYYPTAMKDPVSFRWTLSSHFRNTMQPLISGKDSMKAPPQFMLY
ncbi:hypothetical protein LOAG_07213 [Loa loa]|uniref:Uncharacterized protein n=1 Tax=Loa loa TaxID=7209 RepID=A0A1S0TW27_LOALO|nr:hypothetical protein LOAG_07213 [Loa loa]EFO21273.1 hypothetical protein LOAG_07213 [Loa loa]